MIINKAKYIVDVLKSKGLIIPEKEEEVLNVLGSEESLPKEYQVKKTILNLLSNYSCNISTEDVDSIYNIITSKFKEEVSLSQEDIKSQILVYLKQRDSPKDSLTSLVDLYFKPRFFLF